ncbi:MAG: V-type ATP synthase subunit I [Clostridia bacterium]|nr:V-type ATP synthase subunit I [Clostridia bacterium]
MSVVTMKKLTLVAHTKDKRKILKALTGLGTAEICTASSYDNTEKREDSDLRSEIERKLARLTFAFAFLKDTYNVMQKAAKHEEKADDIKELKLNLKRENKLIEYDDMVSEIAENEYDLFETVSLLEDFNSRLTDIKTETARLNNLYDQITDYLSFDIKFSDIKDTQRIAMFLGLIPEGKAQTLQEVLPPSAVFVHHVADKNEAVFIAVNKEDKEETSKLLAAADFARCPFTFESTAQEIADSTQSRVSELVAMREEIYKQAAENFRYDSALKNLYDYYYLELAKQDAIEKTAGTRKAFVLEAWVIANAAQITASKIKEASPTAEVLLTDPVEGEIVPSYVRNNKIVNPFGHNITAMFGAPKYGGLDPNPFVAFFYFLFFGFMLSDAGYGIILAVGCFAYLFIKKPVKNSGSFIKMLGLCGISTVLWGIIFGGWFSIESQYLQANAAGRFLLSLRLIDPLSGSQALIMFGLALGLGVIQLATGFFLSGYSKLKTKPLDGIFNDFSWVVIFIGLGVYLLSMVGLDGAALPGLILLLAGVAMLLLGGAVGKKNPLKMVGGALKNVYGTIGVFSDVLSYARLFGLGLTTGVIGMVINKIGILLIDMIPYAGYLAAILVFVVGHTFNLFINTLGVYVHNSRLQYVEFFGKFYNGEGHAFTPLGAKTKYVYLTDRLETKSNPTK